MTPLTIRLLTICHTVLVLKYHTWLFSSLYILGGLGISQSALNILILGEILGYVCRALATNDVTFVDYFLIQIACTVISPALFSSGLYLTIGNMYILSVKLLLNSKRR
jgi:hypothetical protein